MKPILIIIFITSCYKAPIAIHQTQNKEFGVEHLFTHDGCSVYRFKDGLYHYFTNCKGEALITRTEPCGKGCTRQYSESIKVEK
jgi:Domain of unknown function (DUF4884)